MHCTMCLSIVNCHGQCACQLSWSTCLSIVIKSMWTIETLKMETKVGQGEPGGELFKQDKEKKSRGEHLLHGGHLQ